MHTASSLLISSAHSSAFNEPISGVGTTAFTAAFSTLAGGLSGISNSNGLGDNLLNSATIAGVSAIAAWLDGEDPLKAFATSAIINLTNHALHAAVGDGGAGGGKDKNKSKLEPEDDFNSIIQEKLDNFENKVISGLKFVDEKIGNLRGPALILAGSNIVPTRGKFYGATRGTSLASLFFRKTLPFKHSAIYKFSKPIFGGTSSIGGIFGRATPFVGWGLAGYDGANMWINYVNKNSDMQKIFIGNSNAPF